jgi:aminobenzoyl-glutamate utilization protein B
MLRTAASQSRALTAAAAIAAFLVAAAAASAQEATESKHEAARIEAFKASVIGGVEARRKLAQVMSDTVFSFGELAYQEFETSKYLTAVLEKNGFTVERGVAGIPTAWVARWGSGQPVIALGSDIDCLRRPRKSPASLIASR